MTLIPILQRFARGYPEHQDIQPGDEAIYAPLEEALTTEIEFDAHFTAYSLPSIPRRLAGEPALAFGPVMVLFVVDVEPPGHATVTTDWWNKELNKLNKLLTDVPGGFIYRTRGGYRIIYRLSQPLVLNTKQDAQKWRSSYLSWLDILKQGGIEADRNCQDWTRLYRLPFVVRDKEPQKPWTYGDARAVGEWTTSYVETSAPVTKTLTASPELAARDQAARLLGEHWPSQGRHGAHLALSGALAHANWEVDDIAEFCAAVAEVQEPGNASLHKRHATARSSVYKVGSESDVTGWPTLEREYIDPGVIAEVKSLLGFSPPLDETANVVGLTKTVKEKQVPPPPPPMNLELEAALKSARKKLSSKKDTKSLLHAELIKRVLAGEFLVDDVNEDSETALTEAAIAVVKHAPQGTTDEQLRARLTSSAGIHAPELPSLIQGVKQLLAEGLPKQTSQSHQTDGQFAIEVVGVRAGKPINNNQHNIDVALEKLGVVLRYNQMSLRCLAECQGTTAFLDDQTIRDLYFSIERQFNFRPEKTYFVDYLDHLARQRSFHPIKDYLENLPQWDDTSRIESWLIEFGGAEDSPYTRAVSRLILVAAVRRLYQPGCKFDEMLVLESTQGCLKSGALKIMAVSPKWFTDDFPLNATEQRRIEAIQGKWLVEAPEVKGLSQADVADVKAFLSRQEDRCRMAYDRSTSELPRQCIFIGTTNESNYLKDATGDRRYWPVKITKTFDLKGLEEARDQMWAEAYALHLAHPEPEYIQLDPSLYNVAAEEQQKRKVEDPIEIIFDMAFGDINGRISVHDVWKLIGKHNEDPPTKPEQAQISNAMRHLGFEKKDVNIKGERGRYYMRGTDMERMVVLQVVGSANNARVRPAPNAATAPLNQRPGPLKNPPTN